MPMLGPVEQALQRAGAAVQSGNAVEAESIAREILQKQPDDPRAQHLFSYALILQGRGEEAIAPLERLLQYGPNPMIETQLGMALSQAGRTDEALKRFTDAATRQPPFPPAFLEQGSLLINCDRYEGAVAVLERGLALAPEFAEMAVKLGHALARLGEREKARAAFAKAVATMPPDLDAMFAAARVMQGVQEFAQAAELYQRMIAMNEKEIGAKIGLGVCLLELGQEVQGLKILRAVAGINAKLFGQVITALTFCGHGRSWMRPSDAARFLRGEGP